MQTLKKLIDTLLLAALVFLVIMLAGTAAIPAVADEHMGGQLLLMHMGASGALVIGMPLVALWFLRRSVTPRNSGGMQRLGYWMTVFFAAVTITTVFVCMLPYPSTELMHQLMEVHGYAGFAMVPAVALLVLGVVRWRRIQSTRSATPG